MQRNSSMSTLLLLALREIRFEKGIHPGQLAHFTGKTPKEWASIEAGKSPLTLQILTRACNGLLVAPSYVMSLGENLSQLFNKSHWYFQIADLGKEDDLLPLVESYFGSKGYEAMKDRPIDRISVTTLAINMFSNGAAPTIVRYCCEPDFKSWIDAGAQPEMTSPTSHMDSGL